MTISTNYNPSVLTAQKSLANSVNTLNLALYRMSTGFRVNCAADDAAGLYVATGMGTQIRGLTQARKNTNDALSMLKTGMGSLSNMNNIMNRLRELSTQASNGVYDDAAREAMQKEVDALTAQLYQIRNGTNFNGKSIFGDPENPILATTFSLSGVESLSRASFKVNGETVKRSFTPAGSNSASQIDSPLAAPTPSGESGNVDFTGGQTQLLILDGKQYTIKNNLGTAQQLTYSVKDDGTLEIIGSNFSITGQVDAAHKLDIKGRENIVRGGNLDDTITCSLSASVGASNIIYGGAGNDTLTMASNGTIYGDDGNDVINALSHGVFYGGNGDDILNISHYASSVFGGAGNDTFNYNALSTSLYTGSGLFGEDGEDTFNINSGLNVYVNGGTGINAITDKGIDTIKVNVPGSNAFSESFSANQTKELSINGIKYEVTNRASAADFIWQTSGSQIRFISNNFTIKGEETKAHDVLLSAANITFYGGNLNDKIAADKNSATIYGGDGDDEISGAGWTYAYGEGGNDIIKGGGASSAMSYAYGGDGDDTITVGAHNATVYGGAGNDVFNVYGSNSIGYNTTIYGEDGDDVFNVYSGFGAALFGGSGNNTLNRNTGVETLYSNMSNVTNNMTEIFFNSANETKNIVIEGITYTIKNLADRGNSVKSIGYTYNSATNEITFSGAGFEIVGEKTKAHNVRLNGRELTFYGGDLDDRINMMTNYNTVYAGKGNDYIEHNGNFYNTIYGEEGDDEILLNKRNDNLVSGGEGDDKITIKGSANNVQGGIGNDTYIIDGSSITINDTEGSNIYEVNGTNNNVTGGSGRDTFYINGDNNVIRGGAGNDYIVLNSNNNTVDGGPGNNEVVDNGVGNSKINVVPDPSSGVLYFNTLNQIQTILLNGRLYTIKNTTSEGTPSAVNQLKYNFNNITGEVSFEGNNFTIEAQDGQDHNLLIKGDSNVVKGGNLNDKITVTSGTNNLVLGGAGDDSIAINTANNKVQGGEGNDNILIKASQGNNLIDGGAGNDTITVNANNCTNIQGSDGDDRISLNGSGNVSNGGAGNDRFQVIGANNNITDTLGSNSFNVSGNNNTAKGGNGNDTFTINGSLNTIDSSGGNNEINVTGDSNDIKGGSGSDKINSKGDFNTILSGDGNDSITIYGSNNTASSTSGENRFNVTGNMNTLTGGSDKDIFALNGHTNKAQGGDGDDHFSISRDSIDAVIDGNGGDNTMTNYGTDTVFSNVRDITEIPQNNRFQVGANGDDNSCIMFDSGFNIGFLTIDLSTAETAAESLNSIDELMGRLQTKNSNFGAAMNRLESALDSQTTQIENLTAARSTIMDADISKESAEYVRAQILQNVSSALLTQVKNTNFSLVMSLIQ